MLLYAGNAGAVKPREADIYIIGQNGPQVVEDKAMERYFLQGAIQLENPKCTP